MAGTTIVTGLSSTAAANGTSSPWRHRLHTTSDGYRVCVSTDGTDLKVSSALTGTTGTPAWTGIGTVVAGRTLTALVDSVMAPDALWVLVAYSATVSGATVWYVAAYRWVYSGSGAFGTLSNSTPVQLLQAPISIRAVYDAAATTTDSQHTSGTKGILHILADAGATWTLSALDPHTTAGGGAVAKLLAQQSIANGLSGPAGATNMLLRKPNTLYLVGPGSAKWAAYEVVWGTSTSSTTQAINGATSYAITDQMADPGTTYPNRWYHNSSAGSLALGWYKSRSSPIATGNPNYAPVTENSASALGNPGGWGWLLGYTGPSNTKTTYSQSLPAQTISLAVALSTANVTGGTLAATVNLWAKSGSTYTQIGSCTLSWSPLAGGPQTGTISLGSAKTLPAGSQLYVECNLHITGTQDTFSANGDVSFVSCTVTLSSPPSSSGSVTQSSDVYTAGPKETPTLTVSGKGAAVCPADATSNPALDLFATNGTANTIVVQRRAAPSTSGSAGSYAAVTTITPGGTPTTAPAAAGNTSTGNEQVVWAQTVGGNTKLYTAKAASGVWAVAYEIDTSATASLQTGFAFTEPDKLAKTGPGVVYVDGSGPSSYVLEYEDDNFQASTHAPSTPTLALVDSTGVDDTFGSSAPYYTETYTPNIELGYANPNALADPLAAIQLVIKHSSDTITDYDSGKVGISSGPVDGGSELLVYGTGVFALDHLGAAAATLSPYLTYTAHVTIWDAAGGAGTGGVPGSVTFQIVNAPTSNVIGPSTITAFSQAVTVDYWHDNSNPGTMVEITALDSTGRILVESGLIAPAVALGASVLSASANAGSGTLAVRDSVATGTNYTLGLGTNAETVHATAISGAGPYTLTLAANTGRDHNIGERLAQQFTTPAIPFWPALANGATYTLQSYGYATSSDGVSWQGDGTLSVTTAFPSPPPLHDLGVWAVVGSDPLAGGYLTLRFVQDSPTGAQVEAATWAISLRETANPGTTVQEIGSLTAGDGPGTATIYSTGNAVEYDVGVAAVSAAGVPSTITWITAPIITFRNGWWFNEAGVPANCVELGLIGTSDQYPQYEYLDNADTAILFNRPKPVITTDTTDALHTATNLGSTLEYGYERDCLTLLRRWRRDKALLQVRDGWGNVYFGTIKLKESAEDLFISRTVDVEIQESDSAGYTGLVTS